GDWISIRKPPGHIPAPIGNGTARWCYHHTMIRGSWRLAPAGAVATRPSDFWRARDRAGTARGIRGTADETAEFQLMILAHLTDGKTEPFNLIGDFGILRLRRAFIHAAEGAGDLRNAALLVDVDLSDIATVRKLKELLPKRHEASIWIFACEAGNRAAEVQAGALGATKILPPPGNTQALLPHLRVLDAPPAEAPGDTPPAAASVVSRRPGLLGLF